MREITILILAASCGVQTWINGWNSARLDALEIRCEGEK